MKQEDIKRYIENKIEESLNLDYKAANALRKEDKKANEISKDVSAFANSDGGLIIYGVNEDKVYRHLPGSIDAIDRKQFSKEWLEQIIQNRISPRINGIMIHSISINGNENDVVYAVEIPKSDTAHQAFDKKYYKRYNFNSEPMHDYEIRDTLNRSKNPKIILEFKIYKKEKLVPKSNTNTSGVSFGYNDTGLIMESNMDSRTYCTLNIRAKNEGKILGRYLNAYVHIPTKYLISQKEPKEVTTLYYENTVREKIEIGRQAYSPIEQYGPSQYKPILPTRDMLLKNIEVNEEILNSNEFIKWVVYCDNAQPIEGETSINEIEITTY